MTKQEILEYFKDINHAYNESTRLDDLSHMLDELMQSNSDEDCISREQAIKHLTKARIIGDSRPMMEIFADLPSIQPKSKADVLDKIRAEIKEESRFCPLTEGLERALEIIDKYKAESEDKE